MEKAELLSELEWERQKLVQLIDLALRQKASFAEQNTILEQSRVVDALVTEMQKHIQRTKYDRE